MNVSFPGTLAGDVLSAIGFFTRIPASGPIGRPLSLSIWAAPIAGLVVGAIGGIVLALAHAFGLPQTVSAALALGATMLATGCLHEDGLADVADGFGGGSTRQRKLEIMKDSRIGTFGVAALVVALLLRWSALAAFADTGQAVTALIAAHVASRALFPLFMLLVPPARTFGLAAGAGTVPLPPAASALALGALGLLTIGLLPALVCAAALLVWFVVLQRTAMRQIGGQTGDVLGCLQQGAEIIVLLVAASLF